ncbi:IS3 family transposase [Spiroplasma endosymbiont of Lariophagus distinguendus]|uniref:IS3 family transposase n=1 Tax=Spiroplasma endosymbiont of Lariophagus distinguendus TaxID=2935082 RepID=UPI00207A3DB2|nr:IS3 family transposase [Spiroplasma endosymbiont of Lariophagus distinguendus]
MIWNNENRISISNSKKNRTIEWIQDNLPKYIYFYNNYRPQIKLKGMSPIEYRLAHSKPTNNYFIPINLTLTNAIL